MLNRGEAEAVAAAGAVAKVAVAVAAAGAVAKVAVAAAGAVERGAAAHRLA